MDRIYEVYAFLDSEGRILGLDGGVTIINVDKETWTKIDEGTDPLRYGNCQQNYLEQPLKTLDSICRYKYIDGECILRSDEEIEEERQSRPVPPEPQTIWDELKEAYESGVNEVG